MGGPLKPCECGREPMTAWAMSFCGPHMLSITCGPCGKTVAGPSEWAIETWNRRADGPETTAMVKELKEVMPVPEAARARTVGVWLNRDVVAAFVAKHEPKGG